MRHTVPTFAELLSFAAARQSTEFQTLVRDKPFQVLVKDGLLYFRPFGRVERQARSSRVLDVLKKLEATGSWSPADYSDESFNASYLLALVRAWQSTGVGGNPFQAQIPVQPPLSDGQRNELMGVVRAAVRHRDCKVTDENLVHGFQVELRPAGKNRWVGSVYWGENNPGNEVEIAFEPSRLSQSPSEAAPLARWFQATAAELQRGEARNHSGDHPSSLRAGFSFAGARKFFELLAKQTNPLAQSNERWLLKPTPTAEPPPEELREETPLHDPYGNSLDHMLEMAKQACCQSGTERVTIAKTKAFLFGDDFAFRSHVAALLLKQRNLCAITELPLQFAGECDDEERLASLDRIDSDGDYAPDNLQVVCRFVNRWKSDSSDEGFRRLIGLLRAHPLSAGE